MTVPGSYSTGPAYYAERRGRQDELGSIGLDVSVIDLGPGFKKLTLANNSGGTGAFTTEDLAIIARLARLLRERR
jgi:hypothetical protein